MLLWKIEIEFVLQTLCNVPDIKVPFFSSCTHFTVFSDAIHAAQCKSDVHSFNLKTFPGWVFITQKFQVEKCCGHYTLCMLDFSFIKTVGENLFLTTVILN